MTTDASQKIVTKTVTVGEPYADYKVGEEKLIINKNKELTEFSFISSDEKRAELTNHAKTLNKDNFL